MVYGTRPAVACLYRQMPLIAASEEREVFAAGGHFIRDGATRISALRNAPPLLKALARGAANSDIEVAASRFLVGGLSTFAKATAVIGSALLITTAALCIYEGTANPVTAWSRAIQRWRHTGDELPPAESEEETNLRRYIDYLISQEKNAEQNGDDGLLVSLDSLIARLTLRRTMLARTRFANSRGSAIVSMAGKPPSATPAAKPKDPAEDESPYAVMYYLSERLKASSFQDAQTFLSQLAADLKDSRLNDEARIQYLRNALHKLHADPFLTGEVTPGWLTPEAQIEISHFALEQIDAMTGYITPRGQTSDAIHQDLFNTTDPMLDDAAEAEVSLLNADGLDARHTEMLADIISVHARRGEYYYAVRGHDTADEFERMEVASAILYATDAIRRYEKIGALDKARGLKRFVREVGDFLGLGNDPFGWATGHLVMLYGNFFDQIGDPTDSVIKAVYDNLFQGAHTIAPGFYDEASRVCAQKGYSDLAAKFAAKASERRELAKKLGLLD